MTQKAGNSVGAIGVDIVINGKNYKGQIKKLGDSGSNMLESSFNSSFKRIGKMAVAAFSVKAITDFMGSCLKLGSDLTEVQNVVDTAFPSMSNQADAFAKSAMESFGLSETMAKKFMGTFGAMSNSFGFTEKEALEMSETLTGLAGDVASFYNLDPTEAYTKIKSVFTGETETLKDLGVVMTQAALDQYALANGYGKTTAKMSEQEKVALRYAFVQDQLSMATGDFIKTQDSWANQTRIMSLRFQSLKASLGKGFIAVFKPIIKGINWVLANLQSLADSFANMMEFLTGSSGDSGGGNSAVQEVANDLGSATDNAGGLSDGLKNAGSSGEKAAKKIQKAFAKVDTINKLSFGNDSDSGGSGSGDGSGDGSGGSVADTVDFPEATKQASVFDGILDGIINEFKRLAGIFTNGFEIGFGDSFKNIERIKEYILSIGDSLTQIFTSPDVVNAAKNWVDTTVLALGKIVGSIASIGVTIATLLVGSVATYLERNVDFIKDTIVKWFDISSRTNEILGNFSVVIADIASVFSGASAINIGANLIGIIVNGALNSITLINRLGSDILDALTSPIIENKEKIKTTIEGMLKPIETITRTIADGINDTFDKIGQTYDTYVAPAFEKIKTGLTDIVSTILDAYNTYIAPVVNGIAESFSSIWEEHIQPAINGVVEFFGKLAELIGVIFETVLAPFIEWLMSNLAPIVADVIQGIWNGIETFVTFVSDCIKSITEFLSGLCDFLTGVFTGDWDKAWEGIKGILSGVWDLMGSIVSFALEAIGINIDEVLASIKKVWDDVWGGISSFVGGIWNSISTVVSTSINNVKTAISGVLDSIKKTWEKMWNGLKDFVKNTWNTIISFFSKGGKIFDGVVGAIGDIFKSICNAIIGGINKVIAAPLKVISDALKTIHNIDLPLIGKPFTIVPNGFNIPQIPKLAQGGYVKPNQPQLAMIGDNRHQGEVVAPEDKMIDMIDTALKMQKSKGNTEGMDTLIMLIRELIELVKNMVLKVDIDIKKLSVLLENAKKERQMIGG
nr:MAG TPA: minor tail protein [Caudoviricetes sp.]